MAELVYDCFLFFNELELLEIRLNVLSEVVDKFVLVEADRTFTNKEKPFYFEENKEKYKQFLDKIIHIKITEYPETKSAWAMQYFQRNQIALGIAQCSLDDIILISDLDEIPNPEAIKYFKETNYDICKLRQLHFAYYLNYQRIIDKYWYRGKIARYKTIGTDGYTPQMFRPHIMNVKIIKNGGWHFSFLGGAEKIKQKVQSISRQEWNSEKYLNDEIESKILKGIDVFDRKNRRLMPVKLSDKKHPQYIIDNKEKYAHLIFPEINKCIMMKNIFYSLPYLAREKIVQIVKFFLPKSIVLKIQQSKERNHIQKQHMDKKIKP